MNNDEYNKREKIHKELLDSMHELYIKKNRDYGSSVTDTYEKFGLTSFLVRLYDKLNRVTNLYQKDEILVTDEKIQDTLMDLANYSILTLIELQLDSKYTETVTINVNPDSTIITKSDTLNHITYNHNNSKE